MKINNETKVGILVIVGLTLLILGFNFLKGNNLLNKQTQLYAVFKNLGTLEKSNLVKINGLPVGTVYDYKEIDKNLTGIIVTIKLTRNVNIPNDSKATIESEFLARPFINIIKGGTSEYLSNGDTIVTDKLTDPFSSLTAQVNPALSKLRESLDSLKMVMSSVNKVLDPSAQGSIQSIIANLVVSTAYLKELLNTQTGALAQSLDNISSVTGNLKNNNDKVDSVLTNVEKATRKLADLNLEEALATLKSTMDELKSTIAKVNRKDGSLGLLLNDKELYQNLNNALVSIETLLDDVRIHPKRYVNLSVFGKKDKTGPITSPQAKDSVIIQKK